MDENAAVGADQKFSTAVYFKEQLEGDSDLQEDAIEVKGEEKQYQIMDELLRVHAAPEPTLIKQF